MKGEVEWNDCRQCGDPCKGDLCARCRPPEVSKQKAEVAFRASRVALYAEFGPRGLPLPYRRAGREDVA